MTAKTQTELIGGTTRRLVIGVGNVYRSDDGVGIVVAQRLGEQSRNLHIDEASGEGASLMAMWTPSDHVVIIDAVRSGSSPGRIHRLDAYKAPIPSEFFNYSTHAFSVAEAVEMSRALGTLPKRLVIYGIEGKSFAAGSELSKEVSSVLEQVIDQVSADLSASADENRVTQSDSQEVPHA